LGPTSGSQTIACGERSPTGIMPILDAEPNWYPNNLWEVPAPFFLGQRQWYAMHTKPRQEKSVARCCYQRQLPFYLPLLARGTLIRGRVRTAYVPLFTGYCFVVADPAERLSALATGRIAHSLEVPDPTKLWDELRQVQRLISSGAPITPEGRLEPSTPVEIRSGPLAGLRGIIIRRAKERRFVVQVDFIQRGASVELDESMIVRSL
jgi:transcriptional antiterminator RfaH